MDAVSPLPSQYDNYWKMPLISKLLITPLINWTIYYQSWIFTMD